METPALLRNPDDELQKEIRALESNLQTLRFSEVQLRYTRDGFQHAGIDPSGINVTIRFAERERQQVEEQVAQLRARLQDAQQRRQNRQSPIELPPDHLQPAPRLEISDIRALLPDTKTSNILTRIKSFLREAELRLFNHQQISQCIRIALTAEECRHLDLLPHLPLQDLIQSLLQAFMDENGLNNQLEAELQSFTRPPMTTFKQAFHRLHVLVNSIHQQCPSFDEARLQGVLHSSLQLLTTPIVYKKLKAFEHINTIQGHVLDLESKVAYIQQLELDESLLPTKSLRLYPSSNPTVMAAFSSSSSPERKDERRARLFERRRQSRDTPYPRNRQISPTDDNAESVLNSAMELSQPPSEHSMPQVGGSPAKQMPDRQSLNDSSSSSSSNPFARYRRDYPNRFKADRYKSQSPRRDRPSSPYQSRQSSTTYRPRRADLSPSPVHSRDSSRVRFSEQPSVRRSQSSDHSRFPSPGTQRSDQVDAREQTRERFRNDRRGNDFQRPLSSDRYRSGQNRNSGEGSNWQRRPDWDRSRPKYRENRYDDRFSRQRSFSGSPQRRFDNSNRSYYTNRPNSYDRFRRTSSFDGRRRSPTPFRDAPSRNPQSPVVIQASTLHQSFCGSSGHYTHVLHCTRCNEKFENCECPDHPSKQPDIQKND